MNRTKTVDMTKGKPMRVMLAFAIPMLLGNIFQQLYSLVDSVVVGQFVDVNALAAIGATSSILFLMISVIIGLTMGIGIVSAQYFGAKNTERLRTTLVTAAFISVAAYIILGIGGCLLAGPALRLLGTPDAIIRDANTYLLFNFGTSIAPISYNMAASFLRSVGDSKTPLFALIISTVVNILLDLLFVIVFHWGVAGVAIATAIAQIASVTFCIIRIRSRFGEYFPRRENLRIDGGLIRRVVKYGIPLALQNALTSFGMMGLQRIINGFGEVTVAGYTAANRVDQIAMQPMMTIGSTMSTYTGQNYGAKNRERIFAGVRSALIIALVISVTLSIGMQLGGRYIVRMFIPAENTQVIDIAASYLSTVSLFYFLGSLVYIFSNTLRGTGRVMVPTVISFFELGVKIAAAYLLSSAFAVAGMWYAWPLSWLVSAAILIIYFIFGFSRRNDFEEELQENPVKAEA